MKDWSRHRKECEKTAKAAGSSDDGALKIRNRVGAVMSGAVRPQSAKSADKKYGWNLSAVDLRERALFYDKSNPWKT